MLWKLSEIRPFCASSYRLDQACAITWCLRIRRTGRSSGLPTTLPDERGRHSQNADSVTLGERSQNIRHITRRQHISPVTPHGKRHSSQHCRTRISLVVIVVHLTHINHTSARSTLPTNSLLIAH